MLAHVVRGIAPCYRCGAKNVCALGRGFVPRPFRPRHAIGRCGSLGGRARCSGLGCPPHARRRRCCAPRFPLLSAAGSLFGRPCPVSGSLRLLWRVRLRRFRLLPAASLGRAFPSSLARSSGRSAASRRLRSLRLPVRVPPPRLFPSLPPRGGALGGFPPPFSGGGLPASCFARSAPPRRFFRLAAARHGRVRRLLPPRQSSRSALIRLRGEFLEKRRIARIKQNDDMKKLPQKYLIFNAFCKIEQNIIYFV